MPACALVSCIKWETALTFHHIREETLASSPQGLNFCHFGFSPVSVSSGRGTTPLAPALSALSPPPPQPVPPPPQPQPSSPCTPHWCQGCQELISLVRRLTFQLEALQTEVHRMVRAAAAPPPSRPASPSPSHHASTPTGAHLVHSLGLLNCPRLWGRDGSVHDGFMGLVSCLDQLGLQVACVQETPSVDQPFRCDGAVVARRVSCSTLLRPYPWDS